MEGAKIPKSHLRPETGNTEKGFWFIFHYFVCFPFPPFLVFLLKLGVHTPGCGDHTSFQLHCSLEIELGPCLHLTAV